MFSNSLSTAMSTSSTEESMPSEALLADSHVEAEGPGLPVISVQEEDDAALQAGVVQRRPRANRALIPSPSSISSSSSSAANNRWSLQESVSPMSLRSPADAPDESPDAPRPQQQQQQFPQPQRKSMYVESSRGVPVDGILSPPASNDIKTDKNSSDMFTTTDQIRSDASPAHQRSSTTAATAATVLHSDTPPLRHPAEKESSASSASSSPRRYDPTHRWAHTPPPSSSPDSNHHKLLQRNAFAHRQNAESNETSTTTTKSRKTTTTTTTKRVASESLSSLSPTDLMDSPSFEGVDLESHPVASALPRPPFNMYEAAEEEEEEEEVDEETEVLSTPSTPTIRGVAPHQSKSNYSRKTSASSSLSTAAEFSPARLPSSSLADAEEEEEEVLVLEEEVMVDEGPSKSNKRNGRAEKRYHTAPVERGRLRDNSILKRYSWHNGQQPPPPGVCTCEAAQRLPSTTSSSSGASQAHPPLPTGVVPCTCGAGSSNSAPVSNAVSNMSIGSSSGVSSSCSVLITHDSSDYAESIPEVDSDSGALEEEEGEEEEEEDDGEGRGPFGRFGRGKTANSRTQRFSSSSSVDRLRQVTPSRRSSSQDSEPENVGERRPRSRAGLHADSDATSSSSATPTPTDVETASVHSGRGVGGVAGASLEREASTCSSTDVKSAESLGNSTHRKKMTAAERLRVKKLVLLNPTLEAS